MSVSADTHFPFEYNISIFGLGFPLIFPIVCHTSAVLSFLFKVATYLFQLSRFFNLEVLFVTARARFHIILSCTSSDCLYSQYRLSLSHAMPYCIPRTTMALCSTCAFYTSELAYHKLVRSTHTEFPPLLLPIPVFLQFYSSGNPFYIFFNYPSCN